MFFSGGTNNKRTGELLAVLVPAHASRFRFANGGAIYTDLDRPQRVREIWLPRVSNEDVTRYCSSENAFQYGFWVNGKGTGAIKPMQARTTKLRHNKPLRPPQQLGDIKKQRDNTRAQGRRPSSGVNDPTAGDSSKRQSSFSSVASLDGFAAMSEGDASVALPEGAKASKEWAPLGYDGLPMKFGSPSGSRRTSSASRRGSTRSRSSSLCSVRSTASRKTTWSPLSEHV